MPELHVPQEAYISIVHATWTSCTSFEKILRSGLHFYIKLKITKISNIWVNIAIIKRLYIGYPNHVYYKVPIF